MTKPTWYSDDPPPGVSLTPMAWIRAVVRGAACLVTLTLVVILLGITRLIERPLVGAARPVSSWVTQIGSVICLWIVGIKRIQHGTPLHGGGAVVANHSSWLDILVLNAGQRICFVSKAEVAKWPAIGTLATLSGTLFIARDRRQAQHHVQQIKDRIDTGSKLLIFPEGTSSDGQRILPFKSTLFAGLMQDGLTIQAVSVHYAAPPDTDPRFYGWWGGMSLGPHLLVVLSAARRGTVTVTYHAPSATMSHAHRKALSAHLQTQVEVGFAATPVAAPQSA